MSHSTIYWIDGVSSGRLAIMARPRAGDWLDDEIANWALEGVRAVGANALEEIIYGVLPQVMPLWISYALYRLESNIRSASVVGMVGAGGIGVVLYELLRSFQYAQTCAVLILIIILVSLTDWASSILRRRQI